MYTYYPYAHEIASAQQAAVARHAEFYAQVHAELHRRRRRRPAPIARSTR